MVLLINQDVFRSERVAVARIPRYPANLCQVVQSLPDGAVAGVEAVDQSDELAATVSLQFSEHGKAVAITSRNLYPTIFLGFFFQTLGLIKYICYKIYA